jgi:hypothetical protein
MLEMGVGSWHHGQTQTREDESDWDAPLRRPPRRARCRPARWPNRTSKTLVLATSFTRGTSTGTTSGLSGEQLPIHFCTTSAMAIGHLYSDAVVYRYCNLEAEIAQEHSSESQHCIQETELNSTLES